MARFHNKVGETLQHFMETYKFRDPLKSEKDRYDAVVVVNGHGKLQEEMADVLPLEGIRQKTIILANIGDKACFSFDLFDQYRETFMENSLNRTAELSLRELKDFLTRLGRRKKNAYKKVGREAGLGETLYERYCKPREDGRKITCTTRGIIGDDESAYRNRRWTFDDNTYGVSLLTRKDYKKGKTSIFFKETIDGEDRKIKSITKTALLDVLKRLGLTRVLIVDLACNNTGNLSPELMDELMHTNTWGGKTRRARPRVNRTRNCF